MSTSPTTPRRSPAAKGANFRRPGVRELAAQTTRESILKAAIKVFAKEGYSGGRVEQISKAAKSYDRMIYYYFGSKEGLFIAALEEIYRRFNEAEAELSMSRVDPVEDLRTMVRFIWDYYRKHPEFIALLNAENLHRGQHISKSLRAQEYSSAAISVLAQVLQAGADQGVFRADIAARDVYLLMASLGYFYLSNQYTLSAFLGEDLQAQASLTHWEVFITDAVLRTVALTPLAQSPVAA